MSKQPKFLRTFTEENKSMIVHLDEVDCFTPHPTDGELTKIHWRGVAGSTTIRENFRDLDVVLAIHGLSIETPGTQTRRNQRPVRDEEGGNEA